MYGTEWENDDLQYPYGLFIPDAYGEMKVSYSSTGPIIKGVCSNGNGVAVVSETQIYFSTMDLVV